MSHHFVEIVIKFPQISLPNLVVCACSGCQFVHWEESTTGLLGYVLKNVLLSCSSAFC